MGDIEEPVLYVNHKSFDYNGHEVSKGLPDPFVDSLIHDSIIVQIPLLHGQVNNRLEKVLSVFDQSMKDSHNRQVLTIDEDLYVGDDDMMYILRRLLAAASDSKLRQDMNVEDEYFRAIESRDTAIMARDKIIAEKDTQIAEKDTQIAEKDSRIAEQNALLEAMIRNLLNSGMKMEKVAEIVGLDANRILKILNL